MKLVLTYFPYEILCIRMVWPSVRGRYSRYETVSQRVFFVIASERSERSNPIYIAIASSLHSVAPRNDILLLL